MSMRADRIKAGYSLAGFPNRKVTAVERVPKDGWPKPWVRITTESGTSHVYPPDYPLEVWTNTSADLEDQS